jgi:hypothetical protein
MKVALALVLLAPPVFAIAQSMEPRAYSNPYARTGSDFESVGIIWQHLWGESP